MAFLLPKGESELVLDGAREKNQLAGKPCHVQVDPSPPLAKPRKKLGTSTFKYRPKDSELFDELRELDVLSHRRGGSNRHPGNQKYRQLITDLRKEYQRTSGRRVKKLLCQATLAFIKEYGGCFVKKDRHSGMRYYEIPEEEARNKIAQALRETKAFKLMSPVDRSDVIQE
jgi:hypothetical protein